MSRIDPQTWLPRDRAAVVADIVVRLVTDFIIGADVDAPLRDRIADRLREEFAGVRDDMVNDLKGGEQL